MLQKLVCSAAVVLLISVCGCGRGGVEVGATAPVAGSVNLDGKPMPAGEISFIIEGKPAQISPIANGRFEGVALPGENRVEVKVYETRTDPMTGDDEQVNILPPRFNTQTTLKAPVTNEGPNEFQFDVKAK